MRDVLLLVFIGATLLAAFRYPFAALLMWAWFTLATPQQASYWAAQYSLNTIIAGVTFIAFFLHRDYRHWRVSALTWVMIGFTAWLWLAQQTSWLPSLSEPLFDRFFKVMLFIILCAVSVTSRLRFHALLWMLVLVIGFYGAKGGVYYVVKLGSAQYFGLTDTILQDNNHIGLAMAVLLPLLLYVISQAKSQLVRWGTWAVFFATIIGVVATDSRGALVATVAFGGLMWWRSHSKIKSGLVMVATVALALQFAPAEWWERMETIQDAAAGEDVSFMGRVEAWTINFRLANESPITGVGLRVPYDQYIANTVADYKARAAHSIYFEILGGTGYGGLLIYLTMFAVAWLKANGAERRYKSTEGESWKSDFGKYSKMAIVVFAVGGASVSMEMWEGYLIVIALIAAIDDIQGPETVGSEDPRVRKIREGRNKSSRELVKDKMPPRNLDPDDVVAPKPDRESEPA